MTGFLDDRGRRAGGMIRRAAERIGPAPHPAAVRRRGRRRAQARIALVLLAAIGTTVAGRDLLPAGQQVGQLGLRDLDPRVVATIAIGQPGRRDADNATPLVAADSGSVWVLDSSNREVLRVDPRRNAISRRIGVSLGEGWVPVGIWALAGSAWVLSADAAGGATMQRIDPERARLAHTYRLPRSSFESPPDLVAAEGALWLATDDGTLRIDRTSVRADSLPGSAPGRVRLAVADGRVWASSPPSTLSGIDPRSGRVVHQIDGLTGADPTSDLAGDGGSLWVLAEGGSLQRLELPSGRVEASLPLGQDFGTNPVSVVAGGGTVAAIGPKALYLVDAHGARVRAEVRLDAPGSVAVGAGAIWVADAYHGVLLRVDPRA
jgi:streptogramin lyase